MNYVKYHNTFGVEAKEIPCLVGTGSPDPNITTVGLLYMDQNTGTIYKRTQTQWITHNLTNGAGEGSLVQSGSADGVWSMAEGESYVRGDFAHGEGSMTIVDGFASHGEGLTTTVTEILVTDEELLAIPNLPRTQFDVTDYEEDILYGINTIAVLENGTTIEAYRAIHTDSEDNLSSIYNRDHWALCDKNGDRWIISDPTGAHAEGYLSYAYDLASHAEGLSTNARGSASHAEGNRTIAFGHDSHAEGFKTLAEGIYAHSEGYKTQALGVASHAEGSRTTASGRRSHAQGSYTHAYGNNSFASGTGSIAVRRNEIVFGTYNKLEDPKAVNGYQGDWDPVADYLQNSVVRYEDNLYHCEQNIVGGRDITPDLDTEYWDIFNPDKVAPTLFSIGNGDVDARSNAFTLSHNGHGTFTQGARAKTYCQDSGKTANKTPQFRNIVVVDSMPSDLSQFAIGDLIFITE